MTWAPAQLTQWLQRIEAKAPRATLFELLELGPSADSAAITAAFHRIAGGAHPDLHRHVLAPAEQERLESAYGKIAAAYDTLRDPKSREKYRKELVDRGKPIAMPPVLGGSQAIPVQRPARAKPEPPYGSPGGPASAPERPVPAGFALAGRTGQATLAPAMGTPLEPRGKTPSTPSRAPSPTLATPPTAPLPEPARTTTPSTARLTGPRATTAPRTTTASRAPADTRTPLITPPPPMPAPAAGAPPTPSRTTTPSSARAPSPTTSSPRGKVGSSPPAGGVAPRAQAYFRKAQSCLSQGDLGGALFNLRLAAAADPSSAIIRMALGEVEAEMRGGK
jgi:hypothetical protein